MKMILRSFIFMAFLLFLLEPSAHSEIVFAPHPPPEEKPLPYTITEKGCEVEAKASPEGLANFFKKVGESDSLCKIEVKTPQQGNPNKTTFRKKVFLPNEIYLLDNTLSIINKTPTLDLFIEGPKVGALDFPLSVFRPKDNFKDTCAFKLQNNIVFENVMIEGFPEKGICNTDGVTLIHVWAINEKTGVYIMAQDLISPEKKGGVYNSFFQKNSDQAIYSKTIYVEASENIFKQNIPLVYEQGLISYPVPEILNVKKDKDKIIIKYKPGNIQLKNLGNEISRVKVSGNGIVDYDPIPGYDISCKKIESGNVECSFPASRMQEGFSAPYNLVTIAATYEALGGGKHTTPFSNIGTVEEKSSLPANNENKEGACHISAGTSFTEIKKLIEETASTDMKCRVEYDSNGNKAVKKVIYFPSDTFHFSSTLNITNNNFDIPIELRGPANGNQAGAIPTAVFVPEAGFPDNSPGLHLHSGGIRLENFLLQNFPKAIITNGGDIYLSYLWFKKNNVAFEAQSNPDSPKNVFVKDCFFEENINSLLSHTLDLSLLGNYYKNNGNLFSMEEALIQKYPAPSIMAASDFGQETHVNVLVNKKMGVFPKLIEIFKIDPNLQGKVEPIPYNKMQCNPSSSGKFSECIFKSELLKMLSGVSAPALSASITYTNDKNQEHSTLFNNVYVMKAPEATPPPKPEVPPEIKDPPASILPEEDPTKLTPPLEPSEKQANPPFKIEEPVSTGSHTSGSSGESNDHAGNGASTTTATNNNGESSSSSCALQTTSSESFHILNFIIGLGIMGMMGLKRVKNKL